MMTLEIVTQESLKAILNQNGFQNAQVAGDEILSGFVIQESTKSIAIFHYFRDEFEMEDLLKWLKKYSACLAQADIDHKIDTDQLLILIPFTTNSH
jgi:hypothetical protein